MNRVTVTLGTGRYAVVVGAGVMRELAPLLADRRRVAVVSQAAIAQHHAEGICSVLPSAEVFLIDEGEEAKSLATVEQLTREFAASGLLRDDAVVALGGGVVGDVAGFAAAVYHRGVAVAQVPTTLLAQIDSAVGGKTGVNLPEGKNLVGAFHQPVGVVADVDTLATLAEREYRAGLGEVAKYALIAELAELDGFDGDHGALAPLVRTHAARVRARDPEALVELVTRCVELKAGVVMRDPEERSGLRAILNYGHTLAHALETSAGYDLLHGEAVAIGLVFAGALAGALARIDDATCESHRELVAALGLPTRAPAGLDAGKLLELMRRDKKAKGGLTLVLAGPQGLELVDDPPPAALARAFLAVGVEG